MVKTRRSNGETGEIEERNEAQNEVGNASDDKPISNWCKRELRSSQYTVSRKITRWPAKYNRRVRTIKMPRIMYPESDTEPEKYLRRSRPMRVFFTGDTESTNRSVQIRHKRGPRKNYMEDSEDKPIQQNVRRSCRKRKLLHHSFNESWITNELKVRGYPGLYGLPGSSTSDEFSSADEAQQQNGKITQRTQNGPTNTDEDTQSARQTRNSSRFSRKKIDDASESDLDADNDQTVIEIKPKIEHQNEDHHMEAEEGSNTEGPNNKDNDAQDSESNQGPSRATRRTSNRRRKKDDEMVSESDSSYSATDDLVLNRPPRRSNRTRKPKPAFVEITPRQTPNTFTIRNKPYSLRERKPALLRRKTKRAQSPSSDSSSSSSDNEEALNVSVKNKTKGRQKSKSTDKTTERALREIQPIEVDGSVRFTSVGGLEDHVQSLREMVLFPLMYPNLFQKFKTRPAKGILFHGPPGTGKTLLARALANECTLVGGRKVAFFVRKGADCLKKWVGESERHLKLLFQQANKMKPSIIFFDEIDALAPVRSVRQEQVHTSVVGTLLAELDGLSDRGEIVVIGATNRLDAIDPALRRAGRFDRELHFPQPHIAARKDILVIYTKHWDPRPDDIMLDYLARITNGYGGSDLKALCSEAVLKALKRVYPQVYESEDALVIDTNKVEVTTADMVAAMQSLVAAAARTHPMPAKPLAPHVMPLLQEQVDSAMQALEKIYNSSHKTRICEGLTSSSVLLVTGPCAETHIAPALLVSLERCAVKELSMSTLHSALVFTQEQALISVFTECRRADRGCVLYVRDIAALWTQLGTAGAALLKQLWRSRAAGDNTLLLATATVPHSDLPCEVQEMFPIYKDCVYHIREPNSSEVTAFLKTAILDAPLNPPSQENSEKPPPLPKAPPPPPPQESPVEVARKKRKDDYKLRELRIFLRDICRKLASNRRFYKFTKPVDLEEVTDYLDIVKQPMDLETMMTKVDIHQYHCAKEFLDDVDLICANALEYNPDRTSSDKQIRHEACSLRDHAHALIEVEMDSDFEQECQEIARHRREEGTKADADLPDFIYTESNLSRGFLTVGSESKVQPHSMEKGDASVVRRKRRRHNTWKRGCVVKRQKTQKSFTKDQNVIITDEESKENKPIITSTPIPNGSAHASETSNDDTVSDDDVEAIGLNTTNDPADSVLQLTMQGAVKSPIAHSPTKSNEKVERSKVSPKKRNSGHDNLIDSDKLLINKTELESLLYKNVKQLRMIGLDALLDLHSQIISCVQGYSRTYDRTKLPMDILNIVQRYLHHVGRK